MGLGFVPQRLPPAAERVKQLGHSVSSDGTVGIRGCFQVSCASPDRQLPTSKLTTPKDHQS
jgi:hypothetical protein